MMLQRFVDILALPLLFLALYTSLCYIVFSEAVNETISIGQFPLPGTYSFTTSMKDYTNIYQWEEVEVSIHNFSEHYRCVAELLPRISRLNSSLLVQQPVYVSFTTMAMRMKSVHRNVQILLEGQIRPTHIFMFISRESYLLDEGVQDIPQQLLFFSASGFITIVFTKNIGPHRKLLPILNRYWKKNCFIATVDDDLHVDAGRKVIYRLLKHHLKSKKESVVALRVRRFGLCTSTPHTVTKYYSWSVMPAYNRNEMLVVPTGTGGILYKPKYFHRAVFIDKLRQYTGTADDLMFRLGTLTKGIGVTVGCADMWWRDRLVRPCRTDQFDVEFQQKHSQLVNHPLDQNLVRTVLRLKDAPLSLFSSPEAASLGNLIQRKGANEVSVVTSDKPPAIELIDVASVVDHRQLGDKKAKSFIDPNRFMPKGSAKELFAINRRGANDIAWRTAVAYLTRAKVLNLQKVIDSHYDERDEFCYRANMSTRISRYCSMYWCKPSGVLSAPAHIENVAATTTGNHTGTV